MKRFAELLDRLSYESGRNNKLRLMTEYFSSAPDPERGFALAALTGALSFQHAKPGMIRALITQRADPVLFALSLDYVGDLSETVALMWPAPPLNPTRSPQAGRGSPNALDAGPKLSEVVAGLATLGKTALPGEIARCLMVDPSVLLLDEPSLGLDPKSLTGVSELVRDANASGTTVLLVEQNVRLGLSMATHGVVLEGGRVRLEAPAGELMANPEVAELYLGGAPTAGKPVGEQVSQPAEPVPGR